MRFEPTPQISPQWTLSQIKNPGITSMSSLLDVPKFGDDPAISSGVIAPFVFLVLAPGGQAKYQIRPKFGL
jgi:hypothetical protein